MNQSIFRAYDVRGNAEEELTDEVVGEIGRAFGEFLIREGKHIVALGKDNRRSSERIWGALKRAILATGCDILNVGETTTPVLCFAQQILSADASIMVTGSHNPAEFNGIKLQVGDKPLSGIVLKTLLSSTRVERSSPANGSTSNVDIIPKYTSFIKKKISMARPVKVVLDCANGNTCLIAPRLLQDLGCDVTPLYCESDGSFPNHHPDPAVPANLKSLIRAVKEVSADVGISFDGDGNRIGVIDDLGSIVVPDLLLGILARDVFERKGPGKIVCEVKASQALIEDVQRNGGVVIMTRVGYPFVIEKMFAENALMAGELTGHICYNEGPVAFGDAIYVAGRLVELLSRNSSPLSNLMSDLPRYISTPEVRLSCPEDKKSAIIDDLSSHYSKANRVIRIDGIRVIFPDGGWALVRPSNTESVISVRCEARNTDELNTIVIEVKRQLEKAGLRLAPGMLDQRV